MYRKIKDLRIDNDLTQNQIAKILNIGITTYKRYEYGEREMPFNIAISIAKYYNVSLDYLAGLINEPKTLYKKQ